MEQRETTPDVVIRSAFTSQFLKWTGTGPFRVTQIVNAFLLIGVVSRCIRYFLRFPLWEDECFLCFNLFERGYRELTLGLDYCQVAPILFLWIEKTSIYCLGFNELSLRLFPFFCSLASLFLFRHVAGRLLKGTALVMAVAIFSVSYPGIRYAAEAKQYASDALVGLIILAITVEWWIAFRADRRHPGLLVLAAFIPLGLALSLPALFAAGGASVFVAIELLRRSLKTETSPWSFIQSVPRDANWRAWMLCNMGIVISFACLMAWARTNHNVKDMDQYWYIAYPPLTKPMALIAWFFQTHTGDLLAYPVGGGRGASILTFVCIAVAIARLFRTNQMVTLCLLLAAPAVHFAAAALQKYPYGGHVKFSQHMSGPICILMGIGVAAILSGISKRRGYSLALNSLPVLILFGIGAAAISRDVLFPWKTESDMRARSFARAFWPGTHYAEEVLCVKGDLGLDFVPDQHRNLSWSAQYQCYRMIELSRFSRRKANLSRVSATRPLRCVIYHDARFELDQPALDRWLDEMKLTYNLIAHESLPLARMTKDNRRLITMEYIDSYKFVPRDTSIAGSAPRNAEHVSAPR